MTNEDKRDTELSGLYDRLTAITEAMVAQSTILSQCTPLYQEIITSLREEIGDRKKAQASARDIAYGEGVADAMAAFIPADVAQRDVLGQMLFTQVSKKNGGALRARLKQRTNLLLFPSDDAAPKGFDGNRGMIWHGDVRTSPGLDAYTFFSLVDGGMPEPDITYTVIEPGWVMLTGEGDHQPFRKAVIELNPAPKKRRPKRSE